MKVLLRYIYKFGYPIAVFYWFFTRPITEGVRCIIYYENEVLLIQHTYGKQLLSVPGGGRKPDESVIDAVKREVFEEVGLSLESVTKIASVPYTKEFKRDTIHIFEAQAESQALRVDTAEIKTALWYARANLPEAISEILKPFIKT